VAYSIFAEMEEKQFFATAKTRLARTKLAVSRLFTF